MITINELPIKYREFLGSYFTSLKVLRLADRYAIKKDQLPDFSVLVAEVFLKKFKLRDLPKIIQRQFKIKGGKSFLLAADLTEQFFTQFPVYFGKLEPLIEQWQIWGRQLGARHPKKFASPRIEKIINAPVSGRGVSAPSMDSSNKTGAPKQEKEKSFAVNIRKNVPKNSGKLDIKKDASTQSVTRANLAGVAGHQTISRAAPKSRSKKSTGIGRAQFLERIKSLDINILRPAGQSAAARLGQVAENLRQVTKNNPQDRPEIARALKQSRLFGLYQEQGRQVAQSGQSLDQVIYSRYQAQKPYLLKEEFEAVSDIIKTLQ